MSQEKSIKYVQMKWRPDDNYEMEKSWREIIDMREKHIEEEKYITAEAEKLKVDWRKELEEEELKESDWTLTTSGNKVGATFQHASGGVLTVSSGLGGEDVRGDGGGNQKGG